jgi:hypothetical protein
MGFSRCKHLSNAALSVVAFAVSMGAMTEGRSLAWSVGALAVACTASPPAPEPVPPPTEAASIEGTCGPEEALRIERGETRAARSGLKVHFVGAMHDSYDDGRSDLIVHLGLAWREASQSWLPSALAEARAELLDHCLRLVEAGPDHVVVAIAPR